MANLKLNDLAVANTQPKENVLTELNADETNSIEKIKFENFSIDKNISETPAEKVELGDSGVVQGVQSKYHNQYRNLFLIAACIAFIS